MGFQHCSKAACERMTSHEMSIPAASPRSFILSHRGRCHLSYSLSPCNIHNLQACLCRRSSGQSTTTGGAEGGGGRGTAVETELDIKNNKLKNKSQKIQARQYYPRGLGWLSRSAGPIFHHQGTSTIKGPLRPSQGKSAAGGCRGRFGRRCNSRPLIGRISPREI